MKILHIAPTPYFSNRGCHIRIEQMMRTCDFFATSVLCTYHHGDDLPDRKIFRIWSVPGYKKRTVGFSPFKIIADVLLFFLTLKITLKEKPDILHGHLHEGALIAWGVRACLIWRKIPVVMDMQGSLYRELITYKTFKKDSLAIKTFRVMEKFVCALPGHFICSSEASRHILTQEFNVPESKSTTLGDTVPKGFMDGFDREVCRKQLGIHPDTLLVLYTGSLIAGKGVQVIMTIIPELLKKCPSIKFCLAGYPVEEVQRIAKERGVDKDVILPGEVPYFELPKYLAAADIALEPKAGESGEASGKLKHYVAASLPVVCFKTSNNLQFLDADAVYADSENPESFLDALYKLIKSHDLRKELHLRLKTRMDQMPSIDSNSTKLQKVYESLAGRKVVS